MSKSSEGSPPKTEADREVTDFVCTACGCTCDDLRLKVKGREIVSLTPPCPLAERFLLGAVQSPPAACLIDGADVNSEAAISRAAGILATATAPLVMGLERATIEAQRHAVAIADGIGAFLDPTGDRGASRNYLAMQTAGAITATLGEVASRSDLILYWNVDPATTHPRHLERFARRSATGEGSASSTRRVICVSTSRTKTAEAADEALSLSPFEELTALVRLRSLIQGRDLNQTHVVSAGSGLDEQWAYLAQRLKMARYATIFYEPAESSPGAADVLGEAITDLVRNLHRHTRAVALRLGSPWNAIGAAQVLTWQTGFPAAVSFGAGFPQYLPGEASARLLLERGEVDVALIVGADPVAHLSQAAVAHLKSIRTIVVDDRLSDTANNATVSLLTARFGVETSGSVFRSDGVCLPLKPAFAPQLPSAELVLSELAKQITTQLASAKAPRNSGRAAAPAAVQ